MLLVFDKSLTIFQVSLGKKQTIIVPNNKGLTQPLDVLQGVGGTSSLAHGESSSLYTLNMDQTYKLNLYVCIPHSHASE